MKVAVTSSTIITSPPSPQMYGGLEVEASLRARFFAEKGDDVWLFCLRGSRVAWTLRWGLPPANVHFVEEGYEQAYLNHKDVLDDVELIIDDSWTGVVAEAYPEKAVKIWHASAPPHMFRLKDEVKHYGVSKFHKELIERVLGVKAGYIYNAVDPDEYPFNDGERGDFILYMNRIDRDKGAGTFVRLCKDLNVKGVMVGEDEIVADREYVYELMRNMPENIEYLGRVPHKIKVELLQRAKCLVAPLSPNYIEVFGLYCVEANLVGTPVVAFKNGALPELVEDGVNGYLAETYDELAEKLRKVGDIDPWKCRERALRFSYRELWSTHKLNFYSCSSN